MKIGYALSLAMIRRSVALFVLVAIALSRFPPIHAATLVPSTGVWKYARGRSEPSPDDPTAWRQREFSDGLWLTGVAPFYYGENFNGTAITDMRNNFTTVFLRTHFNVSDLSQVHALDLNALCDDGFIAWINGIEVARKNAPADPITFQSVATAEATEPLAYEYFPLSARPLPVQQGDNVLAVEVFNAAIGSDDFAFDAQLLTSTRDVDPPTLVNLDPFPGTVSSLTHITVTFSEPVQGVDASDLLLNDVHATSVSGSGAVYTFTFAQPPYGEVQVFWDFIPGISDFAAPPNFFERSGANATFVYELVDPARPSLDKVSPKAGLTLRQFSQVEVTFSKPVEGVEPGDLLINGSPATAVEGGGTGPYLFTFRQPADGQVTLGWSVSNDIHAVEDSTQKLVPSASWSYTLDSQAALPAVRINEIMAANTRGLLDENGNPEDWIELFNGGPGDANLEGWALTDEQDQSDLWVFPKVVIPSGQYLVLFASGLDIRNPLAGRRMHTNFKLSIGGEYLALLSPDSPRKVLHEFSPNYPEQRNDFSYGYDSAGKLKYFRTPTPGVANGASTVADLVAPVHFSSQRGFYSAPFQLLLATTTPGATIRYTTNGAEPTEITGFLYAAPIPISASKIIRAAAFKTDMLPSQTVTHTYLYNLPQNRRYLPALSIVTATNNLFGATGIMESNPRNTTKHGVAWERPASVELIKPEDNGGFQIDCGLRVAGGDYIRGLYDYRSASPPQNKYSFRLYFRGDYGPGKLSYPFFPDIPLATFDSLHLRAGMNDPVNPFIRDEVCRELEADLGQVEAHGTFVNLFLNGVYKGYYNPTEHIDRKFLQAWHGGGEKWDLIGAVNQVIEGDSTAWNSLKSYIANNKPTNPPVYLEIDRRMDIANFIEYVLPLIYADDDDWPHNNTRAGREHVPGGRFRFYSWDAEFAFGYQGNAPSHNTIINQLSSLNPPWGTTDYQKIFVKLLTSPEFRLLFADKVHKHFYNGGALTDERIRARYNSIKTKIASSINGFDDTIGTTWITQRRRYLTNHFAQSGLLASSNAPVFNQFGGRVAKGFELSMTALKGKIYFTTNGIDPRVQFAGTPSSDAIAYASPIKVQGSVLVKARSMLSETNWSAVTEATFQVGQLGVPLRITEIMYNPPGGDAYEYLELQNTGPSPLDLGGITFDGIIFRFAEDTPPLAPGARLVLASGFDPKAFAARYPGVVVAGYFQGSLSNGGERIAIKDNRGNIITAVDYDDENGWPKAADGSGYSLEVIDPDGDPNAPSNWSASGRPGGSPGQENENVPQTSPVRLNEVMAENLSAVKAGDHFPDWIELYNSGPAAMNLAGWSLSDSSDPRKFIFPVGTSIAPLSYLLVYCDSDSTVPGLHAGFGLEQSGGALFLYNERQQRIDALSYGLQVADFSIGLDEKNQWVLTTPTPNAANKMAPVAPPTAAAINEFMANSPPGAPDWIELFNRASDSLLPIGGFYLGNSNAVSRLPLLSFLPPHSFLQLFADEKPGRDHLNFKLASTGGVIVLSDDTGAELSRVSYPAQKEGVSTGYYPDGSGTSMAFPGSSTPGASNHPLPANPGPILNEVLAINRTLAEGGRVADWIELYNPLLQSFDLSGSSLSLDSSKPGDWVFPPGTTIGAQGFLRIWCDPSQPVKTQGPDWNLGQPLPGNGGGVYLFTPAGLLVDSVEFGFQVPDMSIGRDGSVWSLRAQPTPGAPNSPPAALGAGQIKFNEWMAAPVAGADWFELYNTESLPVQIGGFYLTDDLSTIGRTNTFVTPLSFIPPHGFVVFQADATASKGPNHTRFNIDSLGETIRLYGSSFAIVDELNLLPQHLGTSEGHFPDGSGPLMAFPDTATPGAPNQAPGLDSDQDGIPDDWELAHSLNKNDPSDGRADTDGDGVSNFEEYRAGTDPRDPQSSLAITSLRFYDLGTGQVGVVFRAVQGRSYSIFYSDSLSEGSWKKVGSIEFVPATGEMEIRDLTPNSAGIRFYRILTPMQP